VKAPAAASAARKSLDAAAGSAAESRSAPAARNESLREERRELTCGGERVERVALVAPGGWIARLTVRVGDAPPREAWYDETGRLRATRPVARDGSSGKALGLPSRAPTLAELASSCDW
jgi:hypothetical protein